MKDPESPISSETKKSTQAGWDSRARAYHEYQGHVSRQAVGPLLDAVGIIAAQGTNAGKRVLDVATGPGYGAGDAARRGAGAIGLDFSSAMVTLASRNFPEVTFLQGDGEHLPFANESFDAVVCCFGMPQMPDPGHAIAEAYRVLAPGGCYGFSLRADRENDPKRRMIYDAVQAHGNADVPSLSGHRGLRDPAKYQVLLASAEFTEVEISELPVMWRPRSDQEILDTFYYGSGSSMLLEPQNPEARERINRAILDSAARFKTADGFEILRLALLLSARKY